MVRVKFPARDRSGMVVVTPDMLGNWGDVPRLASNAAYDAEKRLQRRQVEAKKIRDKRACIQAMSTEELWAEVEDGLSSYEYIPGAEYAFDVLRRRVGA